MDAFFGVWELVGSENLDEYLRAVGFGHEVIQVGNIVKPVVSIYQDGEKVVVQIKTSISNSEISFVLGEEFDENWDGRQCKSVVYLEEGKLVHVQKWDGKTSSFIREIQDNKMVMTLTCDDVVSVRTYEKISKI